MESQIARLKSFLFQLPADSTVSAMRAQFTFHSLIFVALATLLAPWALPSGRPKSPPPASAADSRVAGPSRLEEMYRQRAAMNPKDAEAFEGMAILQLRRGAYANAIDSYRRALNLTPNDHDARVGMARALALGGQYEAALKNYQALMDERPDDTDALE